MSLKGAVGEAGAAHHLLDHPGLLERDDELRTGMGVLHRPLAGEGGGVLVVEGVPGVGKTAFLHALRKRAAASDLRILGAAGGELEGDFPFGVVRQLFARIARGMTDALEGPARHAAAVLGLVEEDHSAETTSQETLHGLYWLVADLAEERPMLLVVDDAHWADAPTIEFLEYLARRADDLPLCLVIATRLEEHGTDIDPLRRVSRLPHAALIRLRELGPDSVARHVRDRLGGEAEDAFSRACHEATGGNPFLVHELLKELADEGIEPTADQASRVARASPNTVLRTLLVRLAALPESAGRLAKAAAVLGGSTRLRYAAELAGLDPSAAAEAERALLGADLISSTEGSITFRHPLVREVIYNDLSPGRRGLRHAEAAALLRDANVSPEEIVPHLIGSDPTGEPWRVAMLREAARIARERGAPSAVVTALRRVLIESADASRDGDILDELGSAEVAMVDPAGVERLERAIEHSDDPNHRAELARKLAQAIDAFVGDLAAQLPVLERALAERDALRPDLALRVEGDFLTVARHLPQTRQRAEMRLAELRDADLPDDPAAAPLLANLARYALESTEHADVVAGLAERALADPAAFYRDSGWIFSYAANTLAWVDRMEASVAAWDAALVEAARLGSVQLYGFAQAVRGWILSRVGDLTQAEVEFRAAWELWERSEGGKLETPSPINIPHAGAVMTDIALDRGGLDQAEALLSMADPDVTPLVHSSRSRLHYARGRFEEARDAALACGEMLRWFGGREAPGFIAWRSEAALAMAALGEREEAARLASQELELARKQDVPRAIGRALRALGIVEEPGIDRLEGAVEVLEGSGSKIELARALVDLGMALRRARRRADAREPLGRGMDLAHRCGATVLKERAREELLAAGARPRRYAVVGIESLTPTELRVARFAAEGKSNREIAQSLFVSMSTVATHLNHAYQKLQIEGREQLADVLSSSNLKMD